MSNKPIYFIRVHSKPINPEVFENIPFQYHNAVGIENFNVNLCVQFKHRHNCGYIHPLDIPSTPISSHYISCEQFFRHGSSFLRSNLYHELLPHEALDTLLPRIMCRAQKIFDGRQRCRSDVGDRRVVYPLAVDVVVELPETEEVDAQIERLMFPYEEQIRMVPASEEAIQLLKVQENVVADSDSRWNHCCCICLEDLLCDEGKQVLTMPCHHVFHNDCIVGWLKYSHTCPLCRYSMPTNN